MGSDGGNVGDQICAVRETYVGCKEKGQELKKKRCVGPNRALESRRTAQGLASLELKAATLPSPSYHALLIMATDARSSSSSASSASDGQAETWDDWTEEPLAAKSLFDDTTHSSPQLALQHDKQKYGVDLVLLASTLGELLCHPFGVVFRTLIFSLVLPR